MARKSRKTKKKDNRQVIQDFRLRQTRQFLAIAVALVLLLFFALIHKRVDIFGEVSKNTIFAAQAIVIAAFIGFSYVNWRCPSCDKYLGSNINRRACKKCGTRLR